MADLFSNLPAPEETIEPLAEGAAVLRDFARADAPALLAAIEAVSAAAPFRRMTTPGGYAMSVAMTNCGPVGWVTDRAGYRYQSTDPETGRAWPPMPAALRGLALRAAAAGGFPGFDPDACLVNSYEPGAKLSLHQDRDERDFSHPIVSVSLGISATFLFGGLKRNDPVKKVRLEHGDVVVWGGPARLAFHGVEPLLEGEHPLVGRRRINLTFRRAL